MSNNLISTHAKSFSWAGFFLAKQTFENGSSLYDFCRTLDDGDFYYSIGMLIGVILVMIVVCCCINCAVGSHNYSNRSLY